MTLIDRLTAAAPPLPPEFTPLAVVGLDRTIAERGAAAGAFAPPGQTDGWETRLWQPIHPVRRSA